jgi:hypothetical protein
MHRDMLEATRLTRAGKLANATALLQRLLRGPTTPHGTYATDDEPTEASPERVPRVIDFALDQIAATKARQRRASANCSDPASADRRRGQPNEGFPR